MWQALLGSTCATQSVLLTRNEGRQDWKFANSVTLDLCLHLTLNRQRNVLWIRSDTARNRDSPELFEASDSSTFMEEARSVAAAEERKLDRVTVETGLQQILIKYLGDHAQLVTILANIHLMHPIPSAIIIDDAETLCAGSASNYIEVSALATEALQSVSAKLSGNHLPFFAMSVAIGTAQTSTARLAPFFQGRFDLSAEPEAKTWTIRPVPHGSLFAGEPIFYGTVQCRYNETAVAQRLAPRWYWTSE